ncbi:MAG: cytochrome c biogenesis protein CcdA [Dehalococcoidia bacterium]|nr:cytochrome c biogenesis protein CcdA [Dehalococcoidia bacterium]
MATTERLQTNEAPGRAQTLLPAAARYGKSFGIGSAFAVAWTPCIGPILGAVLTLAASTATVLQGTFLLAAWSLGLGIPFLLAGLMLGQAMRGIRRIGPLMPALEVVGGVLVIFIGALIFLDKFTIFNQYFTGSVNTVTSAEDGLTGVSVTGPVGFTVAFAAGVIAFLSPCCLPMVPAYLAHLAGVSADSAAGEQRARTFRHSLAFVLGFTLVFVALGASVGAVGFVVRDNLPTIQKVAGVLLIIMGLNLLGILRIPWLYRTYQFEFGTDAPPAGEPGTAETTS